MAHSIIFTEEELATEEWRDVIGYEGYYKVSNLGRFIGPRKGLMSYKPKVEKTRYGYRYWRIIMSHGKGINKKGVAAHKAVLEAFIGPRLNGLFIDHINGDQTDNRLSNLRYCTHQQNCMNRKSYKGVSKYKGVSWDKRKGKWTARVIINQKPKFLGYFSAEADAAVAYNKFCYEMFGEFAYLNEVQENPS